MFGKRELADSINRDLAHARNKRDALLPVSLRSPQRLPNWKPVFLQKPSGEIASALRVRSWGSKSE